MKLAVLFHRLGPYHHARLGALAAVADLVAVEYSSVDATYAWATVQPGGTFSIVQLFTDGDIDGKPSSAVVEQVAKALSVIGPDVVAIPGWSSPASLAALDWCVDRRTPSVLMSDSTEYDEPRRAWRESIKRRVVRLFSSAIVGGKRHVEYAVRLGISPGLVFTGYATVDNEYFSVRADEARGTEDALRRRYGLPRRYFLASNRFVEKKNLPRLLDAYAMYLRERGAKGWDLVLLGDGPLMGAIKSQIGRLGLADRVHLPGFKQYDELPIYYGLASVFVQASTTEQWGLVVNEAMASGLPVLVSEKCGCAPDLVDDGVNGFTFDPYSVGDLARLMLRMSAEESDLAAMGNASRARVATKSPQVFAENMLLAAKAALEAPGARVGLRDRLLLKMLMRR